MIEIDVDLSGLSDGAVLVYDVETQIWRPSTVLTGVVGNSYKAFVTQSGSGAPSPVIIGGNTVGAIVWARTTTGTYTLILAGAFPQTKTFAIANLISYAVGAEFQANIEWTDVNTLTMKVRDNGGSLTDDWKSWVEITVSL